MKTAEKLLKKVENGTILSPKGFKAGGIHTGLRYSKKDLGLLISERPAISAAVYTQNHFQAAPLIVTQESIKKSGTLKAIIVNSAIANACTGERGLQDAYEMRKLIAKRFQIEEHDVAVASTGVIGEFLQMEKIKYGALNVNLSNSIDDAKSFQEAILTTDTCQKSACYEVEIAGRKVTIGGAAKGSGMIHPNMATMLGFVTTDAKISKSALERALKEVTDESFNQITVDGDTSTNDMVIVMANGMAENDLITEEEPHYVHFKEALKAVCIDLAKQIARDGEGATKLVEVKVFGAQTKKEANMIAKKIVGSSLVKTAVYGRDGNWGRIVAAIGYSDASIQPEKVEVFIGPHLLFKHGLPQHFSEEEVTEYLTNDPVCIKVNLHNGSENGKAWGCDLTYDYVKINASYRT